MSAQRNQTPTRGTHAAGPAQGYEAELARLRKKRSRRRFWTAVFAVALVVFVASVATLGVIAYSYLQGQQKYDRIADVADFSLGEEAGGASSASGDVSQIKVDWDALKAVNPDTVAWVYMPGTAINYPVVQGPDNERYLTYDFDGDQGWLANYGAIFLDYRNDPSWTDNSNFVFGHHMNDGSMFADIAGLEDQARFDASRTVYLLSPKGNFRLRTFALVHCSADDPLVVTEFKSKKDMVDYIDDKKARSLAKVADAPDSSRIGKLFAFATCDSGAGGRDVAYAYVEDSSVEGLEGSIGIETKDGSATGFVEDVKEQAQD